VVEVAEVLVLIQVKDLVAAVAVAVFLLLIKYI
jgi:hypothetical protein